MTFRKSFQRLIDCVESTFGIFETDPGSLVDAEYPLAHVLCEGRWY